MRDYKKLICDYWKDVCVWSVIEDFETAMLALGYEKKDNRKKHQSKVYETYDDDGYRASCYAFPTAKSNYGLCELAIICRKSAGDYFIIDYNGERIAEVDYRGWLSYNEKKIIECAQQYKELFDYILGE